ncbi:MULTISPECIES: hypothetical protein [unclassified Methylobacter]|jgi:hypothetical protein
MTALKSPAQSVGLPVQDYQLTHLGFSLPIIRVAVTDVQRFELETL